MHDDLVHRLDDLCALAGPSGHEHAVVEALARRWGAAARRDAVGNLLLGVGGDGPRTLVHAHADQIGFVVRSVTPDGFLLLDTAQGRRGRRPELRWPVGQGARVLTRDGGVVEGVFAAASGHVRPAADDEPHDLRWGDLWVDLGLAEREEVLRRGVHVGAPVLLEARLRRLGPRRVAAGALDDRVGLAIMDVLRERLTAAQLTCELWLAVTVQEENGLHGSRALGGLERFDRAIGLEVGLVGDVPGVDEAEHPGRLGAGPMLVHKDTSVHYDRDLTRALHATGVAAGLETQDAVFAGYGSDGMSLIGSGTPAALVAVPTRYTHTAFETADLGDVAATVELLAAYLSG